MKHNECGDVISLKKVCEGNEVDFVNDIDIHITGCSKFACTAKIDSKSILTILYLKKERMFVAWESVAKNKLSKKCRRTKFTLSRPEKMNFENKIIECKKNVGYSGWGEETVYIFKADAIDEFALIAKRIIEFKNKGE